MPQLTRQELVQRIATLGAMTSHTPAQDLELTRLNFVLRYLELVDRKNRAFDEDIPLTFDYDRSVLRLIRHWLIHARDYWNDETDECRRGSLHNIVRLVLLLRNEFTRIYDVSYGSAAHYEKGITIWRNLKFLVRCQLAEPHSGVKQEFPITLEQVNTLLDELFPLIDGVLRAEINVGLNLAHIQAQQGLMGDDAVRYQQYDSSVRQPLRDARALPHLYQFTTYRREQDCIAKMQIAINQALSIDTDNLTLRPAFLRQLQIIGELCTDKNLSIVTKCLVHDINWDLFICLRNKISHNEWDIYSNLLAHVVTTINWANIRADLGALSAACVRLQQKHNEVGTSQEKLEQHYKIRHTLRPIAYRQFFDFFIGVYRVGLATRQQLFDWRNLLRCDIRQQPILDIIKTAVAELRNRTNPLYHDPNRQTLLKEFSGLHKVYTQERRYYGERNNPQNRGNYPHITSFVAALTYSEESYIADRRAHADAFAPLQMIHLIRTEIVAIQGLVTPLQGHGALDHAIAEDALLIEDTENTNHLLNRTFQFIIQSQHPSLAIFIDNIRQYCQQANRTLHLMVEGLFNFNRGELHIVTVGKNERDMLRYLHTFGNLYQTLHNYSQKCLFYSELLRQPAIGEACLYHIARLQKYLMILCKQERLLDLEMPHAAELNALRNYIQHGLDLMRTLEPDYVFLTRYISLLFHRITPTLVNIERDLRASLRERTMTALLLHSLYQPLAQAPNQPELHRRHSLS